MKNGGKILRIVILSASSILPFFTATASNSSFIDDLFGGFDRQEDVGQAANPYDGASAAKGCFVSYTQIEVAKGIRHWKTNC